MGRLKNAAKMLTRKNLHSYQISAIEFAHKNPKCGLFLDMGLGKTATSLTIASDFLDSFFINKVLVVAPLRVANTVWKQEAEKWGHLKDLSIDICTGSKVDRLEKLNSDADIHIINRENIPWLSENLKWKWDMVIVDESSSFKSNKSKRFKAIRKQLKHIKSMILLTGTPSPNGLMDLWSQLFLIDNGERLGKTITNYRQRFFRPDGYMGYSYKPNPDADEKIKSIIRDVCITMEAKDYLELPDRIDLNEYIELPDKSKKQYEELEKEFILSIKEDTDIEAPSAAALANKLLQISNGAIYDEDKKWHELHDSKIQALKDIIEDNPNENFLVAYNFRSDLERILKAFPNAVLLSKEGIELEEWNKGNIKMLLAHPASAGHGLNAQFGGSAIIWFGLNWSLELYQQFNARLHRQGQEKPVRIIHLVAKGCLDEKVLIALRNKAKTQNELIEYLKYI
jgi:SNF2 family DNA or RNA helicase